jgi:hypothetical protein
VKQRWRSKGLDKNEKDKESRKDKTSQQLFTKAAPPSHITCLETARVIRDGFSIQFSDPETLDSRT